MSVAPITIHCDATDCAQAITISAEQRVPAKGWIRVHLDFGPHPDDEDGDWTACLDYCGWPCMGSSIAGIALTRQGTP